MLHPPLVEIKPSEDVTVHEEFKDGIYTLTLTDNKTGITVSGSGKRRGTLKDQLITQLRGGAAMKQDQVIEAIKFLANYHAADKGDVGDKARLIAEYFK